MKESEFVELLNLYIDHEISREDAARLEAEALRQLFQLQHAQASTPWVASSDFILANASAGSESSPAASASVCSVM